MKLKIDFSVPRFLALILCQVFFKQLEDSLSVNVKNKALTLCFL